MKVSRVSRIVQILTMLQSGQSYSPDRFASILGISRRTFFRDLNELSAVGVPFQYDPGKGGYQIHPGFFLPPIDLTLQEALSLLLLVNKGRTFLPLPFKNSALMGAMKIENTLPQGIRQYCSSTLENVSIQTSLHAPLKQLDEIFANLQTAIRQRKQVWMQYHSLFEGECIDITIEPYHLFYNSRAWYLAAWSPRHNSFRTFKLNRIKQFKLLKKLFLRERSFDINEYLGSAWSMIPGGKLHNIKLKFSAKVAQNVSEVHWHRSQKASFNPDDGTVILEFRVDGLGEIVWWILGYGDQVEVIEPMSLRELVAKTARRMVQINGG